MSETASTQQAPIFFSFGRVFFGNGFAASVTIAHGRALVAQEGGETWMYGVTPSGVAGGGSSLLEAHADFLTRLVSVFFDIAVESKSFTEFQAASKRFFDASALEDEWKTAGEAVRAGTKFPCAENLPKIAMESRPEINIAELSAESFNVAQNLPPDRAPALAAEMRPAA